MELRFIVVIWIYHPCLSLNAGQEEQGGSMDYFLESSSATVQEGRPNDAAKYIAKENYQLSTHTLPTRDDKGLNLNEEMQPSHNVEFISDLIPSSVISRYVLQSVSNDTYVTHISGSVFQEDVPTITSPLHFKKSRSPHLISKQQIITRDHESLVTDIIDYSNPKYQSRPNRLSINSEKTPHLRHSILPEHYISEGKYTDQKVNNAVPKVSVVEVLSSLQSEDDEVSENPLYLTSALLGLYHSSMGENSLSVVPPTEEENPPVGRESHLNPQGKVKLLGMSEYDSPSLVSLTSNVLRNVNTVYTSILGSSVSQSIFASVLNSEAASKLSGVNGMTDKEIPVLQRQFSKGEFLSILPADTLGKVKTLIESPDFSDVLTSNTKLVKESSLEPSSLSTGLFQSASNKSFKKSSQVLLKGFYTREDYLRMFNSMVGKILDSFEKPKVGTTKEIIDKPDPNYFKSDRLKLQNPAISSAHSAIKQHFDYSVTHTPPIEKFEEISTLTIDKLNKSTLRTGLEFDQKIHNTNQGEIQTTDELPNGVLEFVSSVHGIPLHTQETHKVAMSTSQSIASSATFRPQMDFGKPTTPVSINKSLVDYLDKVNSSNKKMEENLQRNTMMLLIIGGVIFQIQLIVGLVVIWWWLRSKIQRILNNDSIALCDGLSKVVNFRNSAKLTEVNVGQSALAKDD